MALFLCATVAVLWSTLATDLVCGLAVNADHFLNCTENCLAPFDANGDGKLSRGEFAELCYMLFVGTGDEVNYGVYDFDPDAIFGRLKADDDAVGDGLLQEAEYKKWIESVLSPPASAFLVIDMQNDFLTGTLALRDAPAKQDGLEILRPLNDFLDEAADNFDLVVYSIDWHPSDHVSFLSNADRREHRVVKQSGAELGVLDVVEFAGPPKLNQTMWPDHCIQGSSGAELHKDLKVVKGAEKLYKGTNPDVDSYSAFFDNIRTSTRSGSTGLDATLADAGVRTVVISGVARDFCVGFTALDALSLGLTTFVAEDLTRGVADEGINEMRGRIIGAGGIMVKSARQVAADSSRWGGIRAAYPPTPAGASSLLRSEWQLLLFALLAIAAITLAIAPLYK